MKKHWKFLMASAAVLTLAACNTDEDPEKITAKAPVEEKTEAKEDPTDAPLRETASVTDTNEQVEALTKDEHLAKLNEMEQDDINQTVGTTTVELEEQEKERFSKWNEELNAIFASVEQQVSKEDMAKISTEQENWLIERDMTAKEAASEFAGGTGESLEYVATQAELTKERAYEVASMYLQ